MNKANIRPPTDFVRRLQSYILDGLFFHFSSKMSQKFGRSDPRDPTRPERISLAYRGWKEIPAKITDKYGDSVTELDLSHNDFLYPFFPGFFQSVIFVDLQVDSHY